MFYFYTNHLHLDAQFMGTLKFVQAIANLLGIATYNFFLKDVPLRRIFQWAIILGTVLGFTQLLLVTGLNRSLGLDDRLFCLGDSLILKAVGEVSFMPVLVLAARICPEGVEASLYATLMSIMNGGSVFGDFLGGQLTRSFGITSQGFDNLAPLVFLCVSAQVVPLAFLSLVPGPEEYQGSAAENGKTQSSYVEQVPKTDEELLKEKT